MGRIWYTLKYIKVIRQNAEISGGEALPQGFRLVYREVIPCG